MTDNIAKKIDSFEKELEEIKSNIKERLEKLLIVVKKDGHDDLITYVIDDLSRLDKIKQERIKQIDLLRSL